MANEIDMYMNIPKLDDDSYSFHLEAIFQMAVAGLSDNSGPGRAIFSETENGMTLTVGKNSQIIYATTVDFKSKRRAIEQFFIDCAKLLSK
jgi:hypothetical protein